MLDLLMCAHLVSSTTWVASDDVMWYDGRDNKSNKGAKIKARRWRILAKPDRYTVDYKKRSLGAR